MTIDSKKFEEWRRKLDEEFGKIPKEELERRIKEAVAKIPKHTGSTIIVGGVRPSCPDSPGYWQGPRKVWCCPPGCPACQQDREREEKYHPKKRPSMELKTTTKGKMTQAEVTQILREYAEKKTGKKMLRIEPKLRVEYSDYDNADARFDGYEFELEG